MSKKEILKDIKKIKEILARKDLTYEEQLQAIFVLPHPYHMGCGGKMINGDMNHPSVHEAWDKK